MPGLTGFEVLTALKQDAATRAIPVVLLTSSDKTADIQRGSALCADGYLIKPFGAHDVMVRIKKLLNRRISTTQPVSSRLQ
jgi:DNA-binding response OmpR family regulator